MRDGVRKREREGEKDNIISIERKVGTERDGQRTKEGRRVREGVRKIERGTEREGE